MVSWIKLSVNIFEDEKIQIIESMPEGSQMVLTWIKLLALAGRTNREGIIAITETKAYTAESLAVIFKISTELAKKALETFQNFGMIEISKGIIYIINWGKYQNLEGMERIRAKDRERKKLEREKRKSRENTEPKTEDSIKETQPQLFSQRLKEPEQKKKERVCETFEEYVKLTKEEYIKLVNTYGQEKAQSFIVKLNDYIGQHNKDPYKNHYYVIANWIHRDQEKGGGTNGDNINNATKLQTIKNPVSDFGKFTIIDANELQGLPGS